MTHRLSEPNLVQADATQVRSLALDCRIGFSCDRHFSECALIITRAGRLTSRALGLPVPRLPSVSQCGQFLSTGGEQESNPGWRLPCGAHISSRGGGPLAGGGPWEPSNLW